MVASPGIVAAGDQDGNRPDGSRGRGVVAPPPQEWEAPWHESPSQGAQWLHETGVAQRVVGASIPPEEDQETGPAPPLSSEVGNQAGSEQEGSTAKQPPGQSVALDPKVEVNSESMGGYCEGEGASNASSDSIFLVHGSQSHPRSYGLETWEEWPIAGEFTSTSPAGVTAYENWGGDPMVQETPQEAPQPVVEGGRGVGGPPSLVVAADNLAGWGMEEIPPPPAPA